MNAKRRTSALISLTLLFAGMSIAVPQAAHAAAPNCTGSAAVGQTVECAPNGAGYATMTVPAGVASITVNATGGGGGKNLGYGSGGNGAFVTASIAVTTGAVLTVYVGAGGGPGDGNGNNTGGTGYGAGGSGGPFYGSGFGGGYGGGGGGSSAVLIGGTVNVVAGGGGGGGYNYGGSAPVTNNATAGASGGGDGTCSIGGGGGNASGGGSAGTTSGRGNPGAATAGAAGVGGRGIFGGGGASSGGGGGGGGYGGGGAGNWTGGVAGSDCLNAGGGGGGGSYVIGSATSVGTQQATNRGLVGAGGDGSVTITFVAAPATQPGVPTTLIFTDVTSNAITANWTPPASDGGSVLLGYDVVVNGGAAVRVVSPVYTATGLSASSSYSFSITAVNAVGNSLTALTGSQSTAAPSASVPGAPTGAVFSGVTQNAITVTWSPPLSAGTPALTRYDVVVDARAAVQVTSPTVTYTATGFTAGTSHTFTITAVNTAGSSAALVASQTTSAATVPSSVLNLAASVTSTSMTVTWDAPSSDGGATILGYKVRVDGGSLTSVLPESRTYTETGLSSGVLHTITVQAENSAGLSAVQSVSATTTAAASISAPTAMIDTPITITLAGYTPSSTATVLVTKPDATTQSLSVSINGSGGGTVSYTPTQGGTYLLDTSSPSASTSFLTSVTPPSITSLTPASGPRAGGTSVTIDGLNLAGALTVTFGGSAATITSNTATQIVVTTPSGSGASDVTVTTAYGATTAAGGFTYPGPPGGGGGAGGSGTAEATPVPVADAGAGSVTTPTTTSTASTAVPTPPSTRRTPSVPGFTAPARIRPRGVTVLVPHTLRTDAGTRVRAVAAVRAVRSLPGPGRFGAVGARIVTSRAGRILVVTTGIRPVTVILRLSAPGTPTTARLMQTYRWRVPAR